MNAQELETTVELHLSLAELEAGLDHIKQSPKNNGSLDSIVIRPAIHERIVVAECEMSPKQGVHGDNWGSRPKIDPKAQVTLMNSRVVALLARTKDRWALAGDQLYVDFDLSEDNIKPRQRLSIGSVILEVTDKPHTGCDKFAGHFGIVAHKFVNSKIGSHLHLRGINTVVMQAGKVKVGDVIKKIG
ncbi:MAG: MOSC domain-containing protein [Chloroflexi bacterium]|nr:MOSC domain-containing protein [Chloroflexota bacterium]